MAFYVTAIFWWYIPETMIFRCYETDFLSRMQQLNLTDDPLGTTLGLNFLGPLEPIRTSIASWRRIAFSHFKFKDGIRDHPRPMVLETCHGQRTYIRWNMLDPAVLRIILLLVAYRSTYILLSTRPVSVMAPRIARDKTWWWRWGCRWCRSRALVGLLGFRLSLDEVKRRRKKSH